jgi:hypothetical protein
VSSSFPISNSISLYVKLKLKLEEKKLQFHASLMYLPRKSDDLSKLFHFCVPFCASK